MYNNLIKTRKNMKAIYQKPSTECIYVKVSQVIAASLPKNVEEGFNPDTAPETTETSGNLSRRSVWEDEEEEF